MGRRIVKQTNGKYSVWSTIVDNFILVNMSKRKLRKFFIAEAIKEATRDFEYRFQDLEDEYPMSHYLEMVRDIHGEEELEDIVKEIELNESCN
ncbi:hypothetical protein Q7A53_05300 [Halobacillus rhizosphaerae]|uniref:hypothetical protein n=1 Tax=Halobacillus rhizosphaerae TaxID=3064889 RepID=UPI00398AD8AF